MADQPTTIDLPAALLAHWRWILSLALAGVIAGAAVGMLWPRTYEATAILTLGSGSSRDINMETEQLVASSTAVYARAAEELDLKGAGAIRSSVSVQVPRGALALQFTGRSSSAGQAADLANAVAEAYSDQRQESVTASVTSQVEEVEARIAGLEERLSGVQSGTPRANAIEEQLLAAEDQLLSLQLSSNTGASERGRLVSPAYPPSSPATPGWKIFSAAGLVAGAMLGMAFAVIRAGLQTRDTSSARARHGSDDN